MTNTYGLSNEIFQHLMKCVDVDREADSIVDYLLNVAPHTFVIVDSYWHYVKQGGEKEAGVPYFCYGSYEAAYDESVETDEIGTYIVSELQFLCANGFNATEFFRDNY